MRGTRGVRLDMDQMPLRRLLALFDPTIAVMLSLPFHEVSAERGMHPTQALYGGHGHHDGHAERYGPTTDAGKSVPQILTKKSAVAPRA